MFYETAVLELPHTSSTSGPIYSSMTYLTWAATAGLEGGHDDLMLRFRRVGFCCIISARQQVRSGEQGASNLRGVFVLALADGGGS